MLGQLGSRSRRLLYACVGGLLLFRCFALRPARAWCSLGRSDPRSTGSAVGSPCASSLPRQAARILQRVPILPAPGLWSAGPVSGRRRASWRRGPRVGYSELEGAAGIRRSEEVHMAQLAEGFKVIDADTHYTEPYDLWTSRAPKGYENRVLHMEERDGLADLGRRRQRDWIRPRRRRRCARQLEAPVPRCVGEGPRLGTRRRLRPAGSFEADGRMRCPCPGPVPQCGGPRWLDAEQRHSRRVTPNAVPPDLQRCHGRDDGVVGQPLHPDDPDAGMGRRTLHPRDAKGGRRSGCVGST